MNSPFQFNPLNNDAHNNIKNYKIAKCKNWEQDKTCRYGNKCTFAHGDEELRKPEDNMKFMGMGGMPMVMMQDQQGNPFMFQPAPGFDFNQMQMPMQMMPNFDPNQMVGMMPLGANFPQGGNMGTGKNDTSGNNDKNQ